MIAQNYKDMLQGKSVIRELFDYACKRGQEIGYENVFDYSLGNPSVPAPAEFHEAMIRLLESKDPVALHGYSPSLGIMSVREKIAASLKKRFRIDYKASHIFPTTGAAGAIAHALRAVTVPGDEVLTFAPFFPEYSVYVEGAGAKLVVVPVDTSHFQIDFHAFQELLSIKTSAVLINTPNNPSGVLYSEETLQMLAKIMKEKSEEYQHPIYLISDEPYREIIFDGKTAPCVPKFYENTLVCYSFSKSLSIPGERIGYLAVNPNCSDGELIIQMSGQISRGTGHNCPSSLMQLSVAEVIDMTSDLTVYETNANLLYDKLTELGFTMVKPGGTFYIFPKALEEDAKVFIEKALKYDLILVPGDSFGCPGYFRMSYCIDTEKVIRSLTALENFVKAEYR